MKKSMSSRFPLHLKPVPLLLAAALAPAAWAAEDDAYTLDPVVVTGKRGNDTNTVVRSQRIEVEQATSLRDLFKQTPEVNVAGGLSVAQKLYVRGIGERMLAVTIDGAAQPESAYHHTGQIMIEPELLKRVEIEAGTGAATAGPGALAGALRFTTKDADDVLAAEQNFGGLVKSMYQSASEGHKRVGALAGRLGRRVGVLASISRFDSDDYRDGNGDRVDNSAGEARNAFVKFNADFGEGHSVALGYEENEDQGLRNKRTNLLLAPFNPAQRQRTARESTTLNYRYENGGPTLNVGLVAYHNDNSSLLGIEESNQERIATRSDGFNLSNVSTFGRHQLSYGYDYRRDTGYSRVPVGALPDDVARVNGVYLEDDIGLGDRWLLALGARYDRYDYTDAGQQRYSSDGVSPSASLAFLSTENLTLRLSHARALRGVGIIEPFLKQHQTNAPEIDPEKARNTEFGAQWQGGQWQATAGVFRQHIDNYIDYTTERRNFGDVEVKGYNASFGYRQGELSTSLGVAHAEPSLNGVPLGDGYALLLGNSTGRTWVGQVDYALPARNLQLGWTGRHVEDLDHVPAGITPKPGYTIHDLYVRWLPTGSEDLALVLTAKNLTDRFYYDQGSFGFHPRWQTIAGFPEPGRDVRFSISYRF